MDNRHLIEVAGDEDALRQLEEAIKQAREGAPADRFVTTPGLVILVRCTRQPQATDVN